MAVRRFEAITEGTTIINTDSFPYDVSALDIRGIAVLSTSGAGTVTIKLKNGTDVTTPRIPESTPYEAIYDEEIQTITSVSGITTFDIELLKLGIS